MSASASCTDGLRASSVRASEGNSVAAGSNPTQANFLCLLQKIMVNTIYIYIIYEHSH